MHAQTLVSRDHTHLRSWCLTACSLGQSHSEPLLGSLMVPRLSLKLTLCLGRSSPRAEHGEVPRYLGLSSGVTALRRPS